jgi:hypothetical protein
VTANVGYRYPLSSASQSFLQDAEVQAEGGKRQGQRGVELGGGQEHTTDAGITDSAVRQCLPAPHQGRSVICSRPVQVRGGGELTLALVIDLHLSGRDVTGAAPCKGFAPLPCTSFILAKLRGQRTAAQAQSA